jgi:teichuronic acid biosynthesis glycosyltransferase TuaC
MRVLAITNMWPSPARPATGALVAQQVDGLRRMGVDIEVLHIDRGLHGMRAYASVRGQCREAARAHRAEVVHVMYGGILAALVTYAISDMPVIVSFCGSDLLGEPLSRPARRLLAWAGVQASRRAAVRAARIIVKSRNLCEALPARVERHRVRVIPNGVDLNRFQPLDRADCRTRLGWRADMFHILFPKTNGASVKRPALARDALDRLRRLGVSADLHDLAGVPHADVPVWMNASDALLLTSAHEGSPNVVKEALACDLPVVSVDVGDVRERIGTVQGCHVAEADPVALAGKLYHVVQGPRRVDGRSHMRALALDRISEQMAATYQEAASCSA